MLGRPPLHGHLGLNLVDFAQCPFFVIWTGRQTALEHRGTVFGIARVAARLHFFLPEFAQHVELTLSNEIVAALELQQGLQGRTIGFSRVNRFWVVLFLEVVPVRGGVGHKPGHLGKETAFGFVVRCGHTRSRSGQGINPQRDAA